MSRSAGVDPKSEKKKHPQLSRKSCGTSRFFNHAEYERHERKIKNKPQKHIFNHRSGNPNQLLKRKAETKGINAEGLEKRKDWDSFKLLFTLMEAKKYINEYFAQRTLSSQLLGILDFFEVIVHPLRETSDGKRP